MLINKREFLLIRYCLDNAMVNLHSDTKKIAVKAISKLEKQLKEKPLIQLTTKQLSSLQIELQGKNS